MSFDLSVIPHKNIVLAVTGGIAAYKSAILVRRLKDYGFDVRVVMTHGAQAFITPLTFQALSGNPVHTELLDPEAEAGMGHIELARWLIYYWLLQQAVTHWLSLLMVWQMTYSVLYF